MTFSTLKAHGLQINPEKSHFLVEVRGSDAEKWLRKHKVRSPDGEGWMFRFNLFTKAEVPFVKSFKYLGVMLSYRSLRTRRSGIGWIWRRRIGIGWLRCFKVVVD